MAYTWVIAARASTSGAPSPRSWVGRRNLGGNDNLNELIWDKSKCTRTSFVYLLFVSQAFGRGAYETECAVRE
jgi:hypothetical protein